MKQPTIIKALAVIFLICLTVLVIWRVFDLEMVRNESAEKQVTNSVPVSIAIAGSRDIVERVTLTGVVRPNNEVEIFTKIPGRVEEVRAQVGDQVKVGQILAVIEHREIALQADQAQAQIQVASASLERAKIALETATADYKRYEVLHQENAVPQAEFERVEAVFRDARAVSMAAESQLATAKSAAALAVESMRNSRITTPIAGNVTHRFVNVGVQVAHGMPLFQVQDVSILKFEGTVSAPNFARLRVGQDALISTNDLPTEVFSGRVSTLSPSLDPQTRRATVEITISNLEGHLLPNMFGEAVVEVGRMSDVLTVPETAIMSSSSGRTIFVVRDGKAIEVRPRLGNADSGFIVVESGLTEGDRVVVAGQTALRNGVAVRTTSDTPEKAIP